MRLTRAQNAIHFARKLFKIASVSGAPPPDPAGEPQTNSRQSQLPAFGACYFPYLDILVVKNLFSPPCYET